MRQALESKLRKIRLRCSVNVLLRQAGTVALAAGGAAALGLLVERLFSVPVVTVWSAVSLAVVAVGAVATLWMLRIPQKMEVALLIDRRLAFRERFSTTLAMAASEDPFARAACHEAHQAAKGLNVAGKFPVRPTPHWLYAAGAWVVAAALFLFMPNVDVLGYMARQKQAEARAKELQQAKTDVRQAQDRVKAAVKTINHKPLEAELDHLAKLSKGARPGEVRRSAIRKLSDLSKAVRDLQKTKGQAAAEKRRQMLKNLRGDPKALSQELSRALANSDFAKASATVKDLLDRLNESKLSEEQKKALAKQLADLAGQLDKIANERKNLEDLLRQEGLDAKQAKKLAGMSEEDLRKALKDQGLTDEQIDELLEKMANCCRACRSCRALAQAMGSCRGMSGELVPAELAELLQELDGLASMEGDLANLEDVLAELDRAAAMLGEGQCPCACAGKKGAFRLGESDKFGKGPGGGPARAWGLRPTAGPEDTTAKKTGVKNKLTEGPIVASWYFKGPQAKGQSKRKLTGVVRAAKDSAAEAIDDNKVPRKYEGAVRKYFDQLEEEAPSDSNQP